MEWDQANFKDERRPKLTDLVALANYRNHEGEFASYRFVGPIKLACVVRIPIFKDGKPHISGKFGDKPTEIPFYVLNYDTKTGKFIEGKKCPFTELAEKISQYREKPITPQQVKYVQAINRTVQENGSDSNGRYNRRGKPTERERATGMKEGKRSPCQTPVEVHTVNYQLNQDIAAVIEANKVTKVIKGKRITKKFMPTHETYGCDVVIKHDESIRGGKKTLMQRGEVTGLNEDEKTFLLWDMDKVIAALTLSEAEAVAECKRLEAEWRKSLSGGGRSGGNKGSAPAPDLDGMPDDIESGADFEGGDSDADLDFGTGTAAPKTQSRPAQNRPAQSRPAQRPVADEADDIFGSDNGLDLDDDVPF